MLSAARKGARGINQRMARRTSLMDRHSRIQGRQG